MSPFVKEILAEMAKLSPAQPLAPMRRGEIAEQAEKIYQTVCAVLPKLTLEGYAVACGHAIEHKARVKGPGVKFVANSQWDNGTNTKRLLATGIIAAVMHSKSDGAFVMQYGQNNPLERENAYKSAASDFIKSRLATEFGTDLQQKLDALKSDPASVDKAQSQVLSNRQRSMDTSKRHALERLAEAMSQHNYSEEEVIEAWRMSQVKRVMES